MVYIKSIDKDYFMKIIDCHVHPQLQGDYQSSIRRLLRHQRCHGISRSIASDLGDGWPQFPDSATLQTANARLRDMALTCPEQLSYLVYLNPQLEDWQSEFQRHIATACGVKLWISLRAPDNDSLGRSVQVLQTAAQAAKPVLIHCFDRTDSKLPGEIGLEDLIVLAAAAPECRIVMAHAGGNWRKCIGLASQIPDNVVMDISGGYPERTMVKRLTEVFGAERILYGSDAPGRSFASQLSKVYTAGLTAEETALILYKNSMRIFHIADEPADLPVYAAKYELPSPDEDHFCFANSAPGYYDHQITPADLCQAAETAGIRKLYAVNMASFAADDLIECNRQWRNECRTYPAVCPLATVDLRQEEQAFRQLETMNGFAGVWISPYLHNYPLDHTLHREFFDRCARQGIKLWINTVLSDHRFRMFNVPVREVPAAEIVTFANAAPENFYCFQGVNPLNDLLRKLPEHCFLEYSRLSDNEYAPADIFTDAPESIKHLVRGSEYPFREYNTADNCLNGQW